MSRVSPISVLFVLASIAVPQGPALTIYNKDFAVVRARVPLDLKQGANDVRFAGVTTHLEPDSVVLRDPTGRVQLAILEQNYRADAASPALMLSQHEGKELEFSLYGSDRVVRGKVIRSGYRPGVEVGTGVHSPIIELDGKLHFGLPGQPIFPAFADDTILVPTLHWRLHAATAAKLDAEVGYITGGMSWQASYNLIAPEKGDLVDVVGWITIDNQSGKAFPDATVKLMAGDVNKLASRGTDGRRTFRNEVAEDAPPLVTEKSFDEFHLYSLPLATTLHDSQKKQVEFVRTSNVKAPAVYVYNGAAFARYRGWAPDWNPEMLRHDPDHGTYSNRKVWVMRELANSRANGLGIPLPKGRTRFYRRDDADADGRLEFTGENSIDHTAKDEVLRIYTGDAFDLTGEHKRTEFRSNAETGEFAESFEIRVRNKKDAAIEVRVFERLHGWINWDVVEKSHEFVKIDSASIEFLVPVPANGESVVTYRVCYRRRV